MHGATIKISLSYFVINLLSHLGSGYQMSSVVVVLKMWEPTGFELVILGLLGLCLIL